MAIGGWTDGYTDAVLRLLEHLDVPRRGLIGPWGHNDPVHGVPAPAVGSLGECVRFFDRWLKGIRNGLDEEPVLIAWLQDSVPPRARYERAAGPLGGAEELAAGWERRELRLHLTAGGTLAADAGERDGARGARRADDRPRRRRLVRRRPFRRPAVRPARRRRPLALLRLASRWTRRSSCSATRSPISRSSATARSRS